MKKKIESIAVSQDCPHLKPSLCPRVSRRKRKETYKRAAGLPSKGRRLALIGWPVKIIKAVFAFLFTETEIETLIRKEKHKHMENYHKYL